MARVGPVILDTVGDEFIEPSIIMTVIWDGVTVSGDTFEIRGRLATSNVLLFPGRTGDTQTFLGANLGRDGVHAPDGFRLAQISNGRVLVYLKD